MEIQLLGILCDADGISIASCMNAGTVPQLRVCSTIPKNNIFSPPFRAGNLFHDPGRIRKKMHSRNCTLCPRWSLECLGTCGVSACELCAAANGVSKPPP